MRGIVLAALLATAAEAGEAPVEQFRFGSIDGGEIGFSDWPGPVLVVNTASLCGYTAQYAGLQALHDAYADRGLTVLAVPSGDFAQELGTDAEVKGFCEVNYGLTLPIAAITPVTGEGAHPFYRWLADGHGFAPRWNFNKVLMGADGAVLGTWGSSASPTGPAITAAVEAALAP